HLAALAVSYKHNCRTVLSNLNSLSGSDLRACSLNDQICSLTICQLPYLCYNIFFHAVDNSGSTQFHSLVQTFVHNVNHIDCTDTSGFQGHHGYQTDTACPHNDRLLPQMGVSLDSCMESYCQRLDQCAFQCADIVRQFKAKICLMSNILLKYPIYRRSCEKDHIRTEIILAFLAEFTVSAGLSRLKG